MISRPPKTPPVKALDWLDAASALGVTLMAGAALAVWQWGPTGSIAMHFNASGAVDRYGDRSEMALVMAGIALVAALVTGFCAMAERDGRLAGKLASGGRFTYRFGRTVALLAPGYAVALMTAITFDLFPKGEAGVSIYLRWTMGSISLLMLVLGAFVGKVRPNPIIGVRTYWSLTSRLAWDKSNRLAGRLFSIIGLAGMAAAPVVAQPIGFHGLTVSLILAALWAVLESWRVWRIDPDRRQGA